MRPKGKRIAITTGVVGIILAFLAVLVALDVRETSQRTSPAQADDPRIFRADSRVLQEGPEDAPIFVEFLDFECEACGALYPLVEEVRQSYAGQITFVTRYFPLPGHANSRPAAHAAEAAARQGAFEAMYQRLFETQATWGESQEDKSDLFRSYAVDLGLDMARYDRDVASDAVAARVEADYQDAVSLGLTGTPSLFLDGERLQPESIAEFVDAFEAAVAG